MIKTDELYNELETLLELEPGTITGNEQLNNINWDSMAVVSFIALADANYGVSVNVAKLQQAETVADILALMTDPANQV